MMSSNFGTGTCTENKKPAVTNQENEVHVL